MTKTTTRAAEETARHLLETAEVQARKGEPRLIAEIFRFLRPNKPLILQVRAPRPSGSRRTKRRGGPLSGNRTRRSRKPR
jgi:hypothetical protein